jgi:hypothetical protein
MGGNGLTQFITQFLYMIPLLLVGGFGIVAFFALPVPARVRAFGAGGLGLILLNNLGGVAFYAWYAQAMAGGNGSQLVAVMGMVHLLTSVLHAAGIALLVAAAFAARGIKMP